MNAQKRHSPKRRPAKGVVFLTSAKTVCGHLAMWAVRQSPYGYPDHLDQVLRRLNTRLRAHAKGAPKANELMVRAGMFRTRRRELEALLESILGPMREYRRWNERKNGNKAQLHVTSRYSIFEKQDPDDDFIDLGALLGNLVNSVAAEEIRYPADIKREWPDMVEVRRKGVDLRTARERERKRRRLGSRK